MFSLLSSPKKVYPTLAVAIVLFFALSAVGNSGTEAENDASSVGWIGSIGWIGFMLSVLALILYTFFVLGRAVARRGRATGDATR